MISELYPLLNISLFMFLHGSRVIDEDAVVVTIQQGATFPQVEGVRLVTMSKGE
jgi:hypothetical protein